MIITKKGTIIRAVIVLFSFGFMFLVSGLRSLVPGFGLEGNLLLMIVGVLFLVLAVFLVRKYWSVITPS